MVMTKRSVQVRVQRGREGLRIGQCKGLTGSDRVREGGQGGSTKLDGNIRGDMHEVPGYPHHEERGRLGVDPRWGGMTPQGPSVRPLGVSG